MEICYKNQRNISDNGLGLAFSLEAGGLFLLYTTHDDQCKCPSYLCKVHKMRLFGYLEIIVTIVIVLNYFDGYRCIKLYT